MAGETIIVPHHDGLAEAHHTLRPLDLANGMAVEIVVGTAAGGDRPNEDAYAVHKTPNGVLYVANFDGATTLEPVPLDLPEGFTGARFASHFLRDGLHEIVAESPDIPPDELLLELNRRLMDEARSRGADTSETYRLPGSTATIARIGETATAQFAHVGDCIAWTRAVDGSSEVITEDRNAPFDREILNLMAVLVFDHGMTPREARDHPLIKTALMKARRIKDNRPDGDGTGIVNGDEHVALYVQTEERELDEQEGVVIVTDGVLPSLLDPQRVESRDMVHKQLELDGTFRGVIQRTRKVERADPELWNLRLKESDDATGVWVRFR